MKFKNYQYTPKKRRGLSTIVGALLFVVLMVSAFSMFGLTLQYQGEMAQTARIVASAELAQQQEDYKINIYTDSNQLLTVDVNNVEQNVVEIFSLVITNKTGVAAAAAGYPVNIHDIPSDASFVTPGETANVVSATPLTLALAANPGDIELYNFKVISSLGTIKTQSVSCDDTACGAIASAGGGLTATLFLDGPNAINTKTSTVIMFVTNTSPVAITNVQPTAGFSPVFCDDLWTVDVSGTTQTLFTEDVSPCVVSPSSPITLDPHGTALFKWDGVIAGDIDAVFTFCSAVSGDHPDDGPITSGGPSCDSVTVIDPNDCNGCGPPGDEDPLDEKFITRPELFLTIPSPFGESPNGQPDRALWGANVVNPTDTTMYIHKITITAFPPASNDNFDVIEPGGNTGHECLPQDISPGNGTVPSLLPPFPTAAPAADEAGFWSCPGSNTIMWRNYDNPIELSPQSTYPFMVKLMGKDPVSKNAESVLVDSTVYTTSGAFGKGNYQTTTYDDGMYANIFATSDWTDPLNFDKWISSVSDIPSGFEQEFTVVLTDFDSDLETHINATSKVIINVPRAFTLVDTIMTESSGFLVEDNGPPELDEPSITIHPDGTTQIIATLENDLGDSADEVAILSFKATAPIVPTQKLMVMYVLANGIGTNNNSVGPLTEIILVVVP
jgi:hypothetical protein